MSGSDYSIGFGAALFGRSDYNPSTTNDPLFGQKGYLQIDAHVDLKTTENFWTLSLFGGLLNGAGAV